MRNADQNGIIAQLNYTPSVAVIQECKVQSNFLSVEYGNIGGASVNMITKRGTNALHGTGYWFRRNDRLNAKSFFANRARRERPKFDRNRFGGHKS